MKRLRQVKQLKAEVEASKVVNFIVHEVKETSLLPVLKLKFGLAVRKPVTGLFASNRLLFFF
jgi:hypothetical protein